MTPDDARRALLNLRREALALERDVRRLADDAVYALARGDAPTERELDDARRILGAVRADLAGVAATWAARAGRARSTSAALPCLHCALARGQGRSWGCPVHVAEDVL